MTLVYRKGSLNEADLLCRSRDFVPLATIPLFWDGEAPCDADLRRKSKPLLENTKLFLMIANALWLSHGVVYLIREAGRPPAAAHDRGAFANLKPRPPRGGRG
jgi:hypothetical protein